MKVLLARLNSKADEIIPLIGLGYLASAIREKHNVEVLDCLKDGIDSDDLVEYLRHNHFDVLGMTFYTMNYEEMKKTTEKVRENFPNIKIIVGGPHPSALPTDVLKEFPAIDYAFVGEAEIGLPVLLEKIGKRELSKEDLKQVPGLAFRDNGNAIINNPAKIEDLDSIGFPSWDLLRPESYPSAPHGSFFKAQPFLPIIVTRGCPYSCTFCAGYLVSGKKIRRRSVDNVISEIKFLKEKYGVKEIQIEDDNLTLDRDYVVEFCNRLINENLGIWWCCPNGVRLDKIDRELLLLMKKSGLYSVSVGIESGSARILKKIKKALTPEVIREKIELINSVGLGVIGFVMLGFPGETKEDMEETIDFVSTLKLKRMNFSYLQPFPGTGIYEEIMAHGGKNRFNWKDCFLFRANYIPDGMTIKEMKDIRRRGLLKFYLRPSIIMSLVSELKNPTQVKYIIRRAYRWLLVE